MNDSMRFVSALENGEIEEIRKVKKADRHNHFVLGGKREYIKQQTGFDILPIKQPLSSMAKMDAWSKAFIGSRFDSPNGRRLLIDATFVQAEYDGISVLEIGEDVWGLYEFFHGDIDELLEAFDSAQRRFAPDTKLRLVIGMSRHCTIDYLSKCIAPFLKRAEFCSLDLYGDEFAQPIKNFVPIYERAKSFGLTLRAHVGEWGTAEDVIKAAKLLQLDEIQHGIAAAASEYAMDYLREHKIRLNITPSSNVLLGRVKSISSHPIGKLHRAGVLVSINSDDVLMFDSDVSKEYLRLYNAGVLSAAELDEIRRSSLEK